MGHFIPVLVFFEKKCSLCVVSLRKYIVRRLLYSEAISRAASLVSTVSIGPLRGVLNITLLYSLTNASLRSFVRSCILRICYG